MGWWRGEPRSAGGMWREVDQRLIKEVEYVEELMLDAARAAMRRDGYIDLFTGLQTAVDIGFVTTEERELWRRALRVRTRILQRDPDDEVALGIVKARLADMRRMRQQLEPKLEDVRRQYGQVSNLTPLRPRRDGDVDED